MIRLVVPSTPPSSNHAYGHRGKARFLTSVGEKYKNETTAHLAQSYRKELTLFRKNMPIQLHFRFWTQLQNKLWKPEGKVNRYKKFDGANLTKLLEDCIAEVGGHDDSQTMTSTWQKKQLVGDEKERTEIWAWDLSKEPDPFDYDFMLERL